MLLIFQSLEATIGGVLKINILKNFAKFKGKHLCQSLFFHKVAGISMLLYLKRGSGTGTLLRILQNF